MQFLLHYAVPPSLRQPARSHFVVTVRPDRSLDGKSSELQKESKNVYIYLYIVL